VGMQDVTTALNRVDTFQGRKRFVGPRDAGLIQAAEDALGVQFPPTYRAFLERLGAGSIRGREVYGVIDADFQESTIPDGIWLTLREREDGELPKSLVIVHSTGDGDYVAIDTSKRTADSENPMVLWHPGVSTRDEELEEVSNDFGQFFLEFVRETTD
jgi:antitoxin YobK